VKFKIVDPEKKKNKEEQLNEVSYSKFKTQSKIKKPDSVDLLTFL
jgi:hypothetical protein